MSRLFGTDGVRGRAGVYPLDPQTVARLGAALVRSISGTAAGGWSVVFATGNVFGGGVNVLLGAAGDTVDVVSVFERVTVDGGDGGDTYTVAASGISAVAIPAGLNLADTGASGADSATINSDGTIGVSATQVTRTGSGAASSP